MRVLLAPDKFRGTFTAAEVCAHVARGIHSEAPAALIDPLPLADGGDGTLEVLLGVLGGTRHTLRVEGPLGDEVSADFGVTPGGVAIIESARFCGLGLVPPRLRDPLRTTSRGLGQAIASLLDSGVREFLLGLGGSATVDGGIGMVEALGFRFPVSGGVDESLAHSDLPSARFTVLCDVDSPILGPEGAAPVFGPQKGATPATVPLLEDRLAGLVERCARWKAQPASALGALPMGGAAGGLGLASRLFLAGRLVPGAEFIMDRLGFGPKLGSADLLVTGEGSFDFQSRRGKAAHLAVEKASAAGCPTAVVAGRWDGTIPKPRPALFRVFSGRGTHDAAGEVTAGGLEEFGVELIRWGAALPRPKGRT